MKGLSKILAVTTFLAISSNQVHAQDSTSVTVGNDGWLFFNDELVQPQEINLLPQNIQDFSIIRQLLEARGIKTNIILIPQKADVYRDKLPSSSLTQFQKIDQFDNIIKNLRSSGYSVTDPRVDFKESIKQGNQVFFKTDTHWNPKGAYVAAQSALKELEFIKSLDIPSSSYEIAEVNSEFTGDLVKFLNQGIKEKYTTFNFEKSDEGGLLDESNPRIALVGTSYSAADSVKGILANSLAYLLKKDVLDVSVAGVGYAEPLKRYINSSDFQLRPPSVIVWEIPLRIIARNFISEDAFDTMKYGANLQDPKYCKLLIANKELFKNSLPKVEWNQYIQLRTKPSPATIAVKSESRPKNLISSVNSSQINITSLESLETDGPVKADIYTCAMPNIILDRLTRWSSLDFSKQRVFANASLAGFYEFIEPGGTRSGYGPKTKVSFWSKAPEKINIDIQTQNYIPNQVLTVYVNGKMSGTVSYDGASATPGGFKTSVLSSKGINTIEISYKDWNGKEKRYFPQDSRPVATLFTKFQISK